jgi:hypothetical protein
MSLEIVPWHTPNWCAISVSLNDFDKRKQLDFFLKELIQKTLDLLCKEKEKLPLENKGNLIIKTYNSLVSHSIIVIDLDNSANAWIKVEERPVGSDSNSRPSDAAFKKLDEDYFRKSLDQYNTLLNISKESKCY